MRYSSKKSEFTSVGALIQTVAGHVLGQPRGKAQKLRWDWRQVVGAQVAQHTEPARLANGILTIRVDSPVWNTQLHHLKPELLEKLQNRLPPGTLRDIRFRHGSLNTLPDWLKPKPVPPSLPAPCEEDQRRAADLVANVDDPDLRDVLRRIVLAHMTRSRSEALACQTEASRPPL